MEIFAVFVISVLTIYVLKYIIVIFDIYIYIVNISEFPRKVNLLVSTDGPVCDGYSFGA